MFNYEFPTQVDRNMAKQVLNAENNKNLVVFDTLLAYSLYVVITGCLEKRLL